MTSGRVAQVLRRRFTLGKFRFPGWVLVLFGIIVIVIVAGQTAKPFRLVFWTMIAGSERDVFIIGLAPGIEDFWVIGDSMNPELRNGDKVVVAPASIKSLQAGMIIVFRPPAECSVFKQQVEEKQMVIHRIFAIGQNNDGKWWVYTHADNPWVPDYCFVPEENVVGVVVVRIHDPFAPKPSLKNETVTEGGT